MFMPTKNRKTGIVPQDDVFLLNKMKKFKIQSHRNIASNDEEEGDEYRIHESAVHRPAQRRKSPVKM